MKASKKGLGGFLFISGATYHRIPAFRHRQPCAIFLKALEAYRRRYGFRVHAYALMPDHYHLLLWFPPEKHLADFLRDFKSLVGQRTIGWLRREKLTRLLRHFELKRDPRRPRDPRYCVLQYNSYLKTLVGLRTLRQKVSYIHSNPVREQLATEPAAYPYASARAYAGKGLSIVKIDRLELPYD